MAPVALFRLHAMRDVAIRAGWKRLAAKNNPVQNMPGAGKGKSGFEANDKDQRVSILLYVVSFPRHHQHNDQFPDARRKEFSDNIFSSLLLFVGCSFSCCRFFLE